MSAHQARHLSPISDRLILIMVSNIESLADEGCWVGLTEEVLDAKMMMNQVRSPKAGAVVLFAGKYHEQQF